MRILMIGLRWEITSNMYGDSVSSNSLCKGALVASSWILVAVLKVRTAGKIGLAFYRMGWSRAHTCDSHFKTWEVQYESLGSDVGITQAVYLYFQCGGISPRNWFSRIAMFILLFGLLHCSCYFHSGAYDLITFLQASRINLGMWSTRVFRIYSVEIMCVCVYQQSLWWEDILYNVHTRTRYH